MKTFTAKELSRSPAKIFNAAKEDGSVKITHDRYCGWFIIEFKQTAMQKGIQKFKPNTLLDSIVENRENREKF